VKFGCSRVKIVSTMKELKDLIKKKKDFKKDLAEKHKYVSTEFQDYGYRLAVKLDDLKHKALYIKYAKEKKRGVLESALSFASDYPNVKNKARVFMWKVKELEKKGIELV